MHDEQSSRPVVLAPNAMVATSQPLAVQAGLEILRSGGSAMDAAIATNATLGVVEPMSCGIGGDVFAIVWDATAKELVGFNGSGRAPARMTRDFYLQAGHNYIPSTGPVSWSVPGCVHGWFALHERYGRLPMNEILQPAIDYATKGFPVSPVIADMWERSTEKLQEDPGATAVFLPNGHAPRTGDVFRNPALATTLAAIAEGGTATFYSGSVARQLYDLSDRVGGLFSPEDLASHTSTWVDPVSARYRGYDVWQLPPNTQGLAVLQMMRMLEQFDIASMGHNNADFLHLFLEIKKLAYEDRARLYADPAFFDVPIDALLSDAYVASQIARIDPARAAQEIEVEDPRLKLGDTVYLTVVDAEGQAVSFIQSIFNNFGSGVVDPELGFAVHNRGCLFHLDPEHPNTLEPGKRPFQTIIPGFVTREGAPVFPFGVMGGDMQPQGQAQVLMNLIDFEMDPQQAGEALRARHDGSSTPVGHQMSDGGVVKLEPGFSEETAAGLRAKGHNVERAERGFGGYQGIWIDQETGMLAGGSEPRKDGCAQGY